MVIERKLQTEWKEHHLDIHSCESMVISSSKRMSLELSISVRTRSNLRVHLFKNRTYKSQLDDILELQRNNRRKFHIVFNCKRKDKKFLMVIVKRHAEEITLSFWNCHSLCSFCLCKNSLCPVPFWTLSIWNLFSSRHSCLFEDKNVGILLVPS